MVGNMEYMILSLQVLWEEIGKYAFFLIVNAYCIIRMYQNRHWKYYAVVFILLNGWVIYGYWVDIINSYLYWNQ